MYVTSGGGKNKLTDHLSVEYRVLVEENILDAHKSIGASDTTSKGIYNPETKMTVSSPDRSDGRVS